MYLSVPDEVLAAGSAELEAIAEFKIVNEVGRNLAVGEPFDGQNKVVVFGRRGERVAALCLVAILGGQANVDMLASQMTWPSRKLEHEVADGRRFLNQADHRRHLPVQSPA